MVNTPLDQQCHHVFIAWPCSLLLKEQELPSAVSPGQGMLNSASYSGCSCSKPKDGHLQAGKVCSGIGILPEEPVQVVEDAPAPALRLIRIVLPLRLSLCGLQARRLSVPSFQSAGICCAHPMFSTFECTSCLQHEEGKNRSQEQGIVALPVTLVPRLTGQPPHDDPPAAL